MKLYKHCFPILIAGCLLTGSCLAEETPVPDAAVSLDSLIGISEISLSFEINNLFQDGIGTSFITTAFSKNGINCILRTDTANAIRNPFTLRMEQTADNKTTLNSVLKSFSQESLFTALADAESLASSGLSGTHSSFKLRNSKKEKKLRETQSRGVKLIETPLLYYRQQGIPTDSCWDLCFFAIENDRGEFAEAALYAVCRMTHLEKKDGNTVQVTRIALVTDTEETRKLLGMVQDLGVSTNAGFDTWYARYQLSVPTPTPSPTPSPTPTARPKRTPTPEPTPSPTPRTITPEPLTVTNRPHPTATPVPDHPAYVLTSSKDSARIHKEPDENSEKVAVTVLGQRYECLGVSDNGWYQIKTRTGVVGYVSPRFARPCR